MNSNLKFDIVLTSPLAIRAAKAAALENPGMLLIVGFRLIADCVFNSVAQWQGGDVDLWKGKARGGPRCGVCKGPG